MSKINIESGRGFAKVSVDGRKLTHLTGLTVDFTDRYSPVVGVTIVMSETDIDLAGARLRVDGLEVPEAVETALLEYLCRKYPSRTAVEQAFAGLGIKT